MSEVLKPTYDAFLENLFSIYPMGNAEQIFALLDSHLGVKLPTGEVLTFELLCERYAGYVAYLKPYNDVKDKQYIKKDKEIKHIGGYLVDKQYINDFSSACNDPSDNYLFGI